MAKEGTVAIIEDTVINEGQPVVVRIEVADISPEPLNEGRVTRGGNVVARAKDAFQDSMQLIHTCATQISTTVHNVAPELRPREFEVQFSVKIDGKVGAFIAESTAGAQLQVTLRWGEKDKP
jgi:hypothetical protein